MAIDALNAKLKGVQGAMDLGVQGLTPTRDAIVAQIQSAALAMASEHEPDPLLGSSSVRKLAAPIATPAKRQDFGQRTLHGYGAMERTVYSGSSADRKEVATVVVTGPRVLYNFGSPTSANKCSKGCGGIFAKPSGRATHEKTCSGRCRGVRGTRRGASPRRRPR